MESRGFKTARANHSGIDVRMALDPGLAPLAGARTQLAQVVMNLVLNAMEAADGGQVLVETGNVHLDKALDAYEVVPKGNYVTLSVSDSGGGISEQHLARIFEPFYTQKKMDASSGSGLGLAVVYGVVKDHGGFVNIRTETGHGTTFTVYLPACEETDPPEEIGDQVTGGNETILVVDDQQQQRYIARTLLTDLGYAVHEAASGREAVELLKATDNAEDGDPSAYDLILLDMILEEDYDGLDTYREVLRIHPSQKCVVVSGYSDTDRVRRTLRLGAGRFIQKPYRPDQLAAAVREVLDGTEATV